MKLTTRFTLVFIIYAAALLIGVGFLAYNSGRSALRSATISELEATAVRKEENLNRWIEGKQAALSALTTDPVVITEAARLIAAVPDSAEFHQAQEVLITNLQPRLATSEFLDVSLILPENGQVIASTSLDDVGKFKSDRPYFIKGKTNAYVENPYFSDALQSISMIASSPLYDIDGQLLGVLAARLDMEGLNTVISRRTNLHETDDAYLVNTSDLFVTRPRFLDDPVLLRQGVYTEPVNQCLQQESGVLESLDYRNVPSFVAYRWIPDRQVCLIVKIDQAEAYNPVRGFGRTIVAISIIALLVAVVLAITLARSMTRPILGLQGGVARFANGELDLRLDETSGDELGQLAGEFNKMAEALVEEQTFVRRRAEQFFNLTLDLLCTIDASGRLLDLNPAWEQTLGYSREELRGQVLKNLIHPDDLAVATSALQNLTGEKAGRFESRCRHKDGSYRWLAWVVVTSTLDQLLYAAARDITERRLSEQSLQQQREQLERSNRELAQFAYVASHDLQEPLRLVTSNVQLLARRYENKLDENADEFIGFALQGANSMKNLLADLFAYLQAGSQGREFAPVQLEETLKEVLNNLQVAIGSAGAKITHDPLPAVWGDDVQMAQLLQNLIGNSIKFRRKEAPRIHIGVRPVGDRLLFFVRDNGIGIDPQYTERVFVIFQRLHSQEQYPGTGIGLAISRKIVEGHGGRIWVDSEPGKGATFYFTLEPAETWSTEQVPSDVVKPRSRKTVVDRASDLI